MGGVNHCRSHCRLAKFRGLMYGGNYVAVIGFKKPITWKFILGIYYTKYAFSDQSQRCIFPRYIEPRNIAKRQCERQWLTPPINSATHLHPKSVYPSHPSSLESFKHVYPSHPSSLESFKHVYPSHPSSLESFKHVYPSHPSSLESFKRQTRIFADFLNILNLITYQYAGQGMDFFSCH